MASKHPRFDAVLFDLDGCLLDTAADMVGAVNRLLAEEGAPVQPVESLTPFVSQGGLELVSRGFGMPKDNPDTIALWGRYLDLYEANVCNQTALYEGLEQVLDTLGALEIRWGIVTNKPERFTLPLLAALNLPAQPGCVVCGDTLAVSKPDPAPVLHACALLEVDPARALMIGDDARDITAGRDAGTATLAAGWGYIQPHDDPATWNADAILDHARDLNAWLA